MVDYTSLKSLASNLLQKNGQQVTITRRTSTGFNPVTGVDTVTTSSFTGYGAGFNYKRSEIDGTLVQSGDIRLLFEATTTPPIIGDVATYNSINYRVLDVDELSPGGTVLRYVLQLRK